MELVIVLSIVCISLYSLLGIVLISGIRQRSTANIFLGIFFLLWALNFLDGLLLLNGYYLQHPGLAMWEEPMPLLYGPVIFFYTRSLVSYDKNPIKNFIPHLAPFVVLNIVMLFSYHLKSVEIKTSILRSVYEMKQFPELLITVLLVFVHIFIYIFLSVKKVRRFHKEYKKLYSTQIHWLNDTLKFLILILILSFLVSIIQYFASPVIFKIGLLILIFTVLLFVGQIFFKAFKEPKLFISNWGTVKYQNYPLTTEDRYRIENKIKTALEADKLFLKPDLSLNDLSEDITETPRNVSQVVNDVFEKSFFDLINEYRIEESKMIFMENKDPKKTVLEVMYESGFNSKSSFNTQFKKRTGMTPSEFKRLHT